MQHPIIKVDNSPWLIVGTCGGWGVDILFDGDDPNHVFAKVGDWPELGRNVVDDYNRTFTKDWLLYLRRLSHVGSYHYSVTRAQWEAEIRMGVTLEYRKTPGNVAVEEPFSAWRKIYTPLQGARITTVDRDWDMFKKYLEIEYVFNLMEARAIKDWKMADYWKNELTAYMGYAVKIAKDHVEIYRSLDRQ